MRANVTPPQNRAARQRRAAAQIAEDNAIDIEFYEHATRGSSASGRCRCTPDAASDPGLGQSEERPRVARSPTWAMTSAKVVA